MKMKTKYIFLVLIWGLLASSCSDFLKQDSGSQTSTDKLYSTKDGFYVSLNGMYYRLEEYMRLESFVTYADALGGNITFTPNPSGSSRGQVIVPIRVEDAYNFQLDPEDNYLEYAYGDFYSVISQANTILQYLDRTDLFDPEEADAIRAEALSVRALCHFELARVFAQNYNYTSDASHLGLVYMDEVPEIGVDFPARLTVAETYDKIITDFQTAIPLFADSPVLDGPAYSYLTQYAAEALLAKVALYANRFALAEQYASDVIANSGLSLIQADNYVAEWEKPDAPVSEALLELSIKLTTDGGNVNGIGSFFQYAGSSSYGDYVASGDLMNVYEDGDVRGTDMFMAEDIETVNGESTELLPYYFTKKFQDNAGNPIIRLSEVYLIRAEAEARQGDDVLALDDLNTLQEHRGASLSGSDEDLLEAIFTERRKELAFERNFLFDLARFGKDVNRNQGCVGSVCTLSYPSPYFIAPIPYSDIQLNSNLEQNEDY